MAAVALTVAKLDPNPDFVAGNKKIKFRKLTTDTGDYTTDGIAVTAASLGLKRFAALVPIGGLYDDSGADQYDILWPVGGVRYDTERQTAYLILAESAADGDPMDQKPAEAAVIASIQVMAIGN